MTVHTGVTLLRVKAGDDTGTVEVAPERERGPTAAKITAAAVELFYRQGYPQTSVREITAACGITPGALYNHFQSKEELLWEVVRDTHEMSERVAREALDGAGGDPVAQLRELVRAMTVMHSTNRLSAIVSRNEARRLPEPRAARALESQRWMRRTFERTLEAGVASGAFRLGLADGSDAYPPVVAKAILDLCVHCGLWFRPDGPLDTAQLAETYIALVLRMVGVDPSAPGD